MGFRMKPLSVLLFTLITSIASAADLHVSPAGNDSSPGTADKPLQTLAAAQKDARTAKAHGPINVILHNGTYYLPETLVFTAEDSGTKDVPVVWRAADG